MSGRRKNRPCSGALCRGRNAGFTTLRRECPLNCSESRPAAEMTPELQKECQRLDKIWCEGLTRSVARGWQGKISVRRMLLCAGGLRARTYQLPFSAAAQTWIDRIRRILPSLSGVRRQRKKRKSTTTESGRAGISALIIT